MRNAVLSVLTALAGATLPAAAQSPYVSVIGIADKVDAAGKIVTVKPEKGDPTTVRFDDKTAFLLVPAGEKDMKKATPATSGDLGAGDHVLARVLTADPTGKPARTVYIEKQAELDKHHEEQWKNATSGQATSIDVGAKQIKMMARVPGSPAPKEITVDLSGHVQYQHYNPDSGQYEPSSLQAVRTGDSLRVVGQKNADSTEIQAELLGSGSFKTIGVTVKSIDAAGKQIQGIEISTKKPIVVSLRADTLLKKFDDMSAMMVARQLNPSLQQGGGRRGGGGNPNAGAGPVGTPGGASGGGFGGGRGRGGRPDMNKLIEQQPSIQLSDLKPNDAIIVTGATGSDAARLTATALVAGVEIILREAPNNGADPLAGSWSAGAGGEGGGN